MEMKKSIEEYKGNFLVGKVKLFKTAPGNLSLEEDHTPGGIYFAQAPQLEILEQAVSLMTGIVPNTYRIKKGMGFIALGKIPEVVPGDEINVVLGRRIDTREIYLKPELNHRYIIPILVDFTLTHSSLER